VRLDPTVLAWHQGLICLRILGEVAQWAADGTLAQRAGHPWVITGQGIAERLQRLAGTPIDPDNLIAS
jgi:hypothetical protein